jgi:hypothetical protein
VTASRAVKALARAEPDLIAVALSRVIEKARLTKCDIACYGTSGKFAAGRPPAYEKLPGWKLLFPPYR